MHDRSIRDVMPAAPRVRVEVAAGPAFELLIGLYAATTPDAEHAASWVRPRERWSPGLAAAVDEVGTHSGEAWLHLLGLAVELPAEDAASFVSKVSRVSASELRRHLVGSYVPAWVAMVGADTLDRAARGEGAAVDELLAHPRYYAGRAREALGIPLSVSSAETKRRLVSALELFASEVFAPSEEEVAAALRAGIEAERELMWNLSPPELIEKVAGGYVYEPEPELDRVLLVPHLAARPALLLCQHRESRIICHPLHEDEKDPEAALTDRAVTLGHALADDRRVLILRHLAVGDATLDELAERTGVARSTAHHHLARLRAAGLVTLRGNARGYWYVLREDGLADARRALSDLARAPSSELEPPTRSAGPRSRGRPRKRPRKTG